MKRWETKQVKVGRILIGGQNKVVIQSMTTTPTKDVEATIKQIRGLTNSGCELVRVAVLDLDDAKAIQEIKKGIDIPLVADIHFDYKLALQAIESGADKIRINPGNMAKEHLKTIVEACKEKKIPIRVGVNGGSLEKDYQDEEDKAIALFNSAKACVKLLEDLDFDDIVISLKSSSPLVTIKAYELASNYFKYPLHLGLTEAGEIESSLVRSSFALGLLLKEGIGDTIRISINDEPKKEIRACKELLKTLNLYAKFPTLIACPTCGRCQVDLISIVKEVKDYLDDLNADIKVAVMGCVVNGPGEASNADIGIAVSKESAVLFKKGKIIKTIKEEEIVSTLKEEIQKMI